MAVNLLDAIGRPVELARCLQAHGLSLRKAHDVIDRAARGETVYLELLAGDRDRMVADLRSLGLDVRILRLPQTDVRQLRQRLGLSQSEFAVRFGLEEATVQNWEQGRYQPDPQARLLLSIIDRRPEIVDEALSVETVGSQAGS